MQSRVEKPLPLMIFDPNFGETQLNIPVTRDEIVGNSPPSQNLKPGSGGPRLKATYCGEVLCDRGTLVGYRYLWNNGEEDVMWLKSQSYKKLF